MSESPLPKVDVRSPKGPVRRHGDELVAWARHQLRLASELVDNPGGGLLSAVQAIGQVHASLLMEDEERFGGVTTILHRAEDCAVHRDYPGARAALAEASTALG